MNHIKRVSTFFIIMSFFLLIIINCGSKSSSNGTDNKILIKGKLSTKKLDNTSNILTKSPSDISKVIAIQISKQYEIADVLNDSFSLSVSKDSPIGIVFADSNGGYIGYVTLGNNVDILPVNELSDSTTQEIDLGTLIDNGNAYNSSEGDVIQSALALTGNSRIAYLNAAKLFCDMIHNPDVDRNGVIDVLEDKCYGLTLNFSYRGGNLESTSSNIEPYVPISIYDHRFLFSIRDIEHETAYTVTFTGPLGSNMTDQPSASVIHFPYNNTTDLIYLYFSQCMTIPVIPPAGDYLIKYGDSLSLIFTLSDLTNTPNQIVYVKPIITLDNNKYIKSISWDYYLGDSSGIVSNPEKIIKSINFQISSGTSLLNSTEVAYVNNIDPQIKIYDLSSKNILWDGISFNFGYEDIFGNEVNGMFRPLSWMP